MDLLEHLNFISPREKRLDFSKITLVRGSLHIQGADKIDTYAVPLEDYLKVVEALTLAESTLKGITSA